LTGDLSAAWSKLEGYAARLALVIHCVRCAAGDSTLKTPDTVDAKSIEVGVAWSRWFGDEARRIYRILEETPEEQEQRELVELIRGKGGAATPRDLQRWRDRRFATSGDAERALSELVKAELGRWAMDNPNRSGGRPSVQFILADAIDADKTLQFPEKSG